MKKHKKDIKEKMSLCSFNLFSIVRTNDVFLGKVKFGGFKEYFYKRMILILAM